MSNKLPGRVGDSPCIGAGLYVTPTVAVCASGNGEDLIGHNVSAQICHAVKYGGLSLEEAVDRVISELPDETGGVIALSLDGQCVCKFNSLGMFHASVSAYGQESFSTWE